MFEEARARARRRQQALDRVGDRAAAWPRAARSLRSPSRASGSRRACASWPSSVASPLVTDCDVARTRTSRASSPRSARRSAGSSTCSSTPSPSRPPRISRPLHRHAARPLLDGARRQRVLARRVRPRGRAADGGRRRRLDRDHDVSGRRARRAALQRDGRRQGDARLRARSYLAWDLGQKNIRVNAVSAGPVRTLAARSIAGFPTMEAIVEERAPLHRHVDAEDVGGAAAYLLSEDARNVTGYDALRGQRVPRDGYVETARGATS